ncbi:hypothetical protein [Endozoicomonas sp.]
MTPLAEDLAKPGQPSQGQVIFLEFRDSNEVSEEASSTSSNSEHSDK